MGFQNSMQAKEFLVSRIVAEAQREQISLTEPERKELCFSEQYPTLPDMMEVNERFEAEYDSAEYEKKIKRLSAKAFKHDRQESPDVAQRWREAISLLSKEDHYILVMLDVPRPANDVVRLFTVGIAVTAIGVAVTFAVNWAGKNDHFEIPGYGKGVVIAAVLALAAFLSYTRAGKKVGDSVGDAIMRVAKWLGMR